MFKIGEFSTLARVSIHLLRHYDGIGLFEPAHVDPSNGYRYYAVEQLADLNRILALRDLGFSLAEIERLIADDITLQQIQRLLEQRRAQIEGQIEQEQRRLRRVASRLKHLETKGMARRHEPVEKSLPAQPYLSLRQPLPYFRQAGQILRQVSQAVLEQQVPGLSHPMAIFHDPFFRTRKTDFEFGFLLKEELQMDIAIGGGKSLVVRQASAVPMALTCLHRGPWPELQLGFAALAGYLSKNSLRLAGRPRELYLNFVPPEQDEELVVEIQLPVEKKTPAGEF
jgi:DNA-binding transcriptional MerR regulator